MKFVEKKLETNDRVNNILEISMQDYRRLTGQRGSRWRDYLLRPRFLLMMVLGVCLVTLLLFVNTSHNSMLLKVHNSVKDFGRRVGENVKDLKFFNDDLQSQRNLNWGSSQGGSAAQWAYFKILGYGPSAKLYEESDRLNSSITLLPVYVTAVTNKDIDYIDDLLVSVRAVAPNNMMCVYEVGLSRQSAQLLRRLCVANQSCIIRDSALSSLPSHLKEIHLFTFRAVVLQLALMEFAGVVWMSPRDTLLKEIPNALIAQAQKVGLVIWSLNNPTRAWTHVGMFNYFEVEPSQYDFWRMVDARHLIIYNTRRVHNRLMFPWLRCCLAQPEDCLAPRGAQGKPCFYGRRPKILYSGCHAYVVSSLSVLLKKNFPNSEFSPDPAYSAGIYFSSASVTNGTTSSKVKELPYDDILL